GKGSIALLKLHLSVDGKSGELSIKGDKGMTGKPESTIIDNTMIKASYGAKYVALPFAIRLRDFILERYPGTESASSYASEVTLLDKKNNVTRDQRIYMNNILNYKGYRFFQSSFDKDEKGTVLSVNHDALGTWISYFGYFLLTLGMVFTLFSKKSRFHAIQQRLKDMRLSQKAAAITLPLLFALSVVQPCFANDEIIDPAIIIDSEHAAKFGKLVVQDYKGRMKPVNTMASEILRKIARKEQLYDQNSDQVFIGMMVYPQNWANVPLIKIGTDEEIKRLINIEGKLATYNDFFKPTYILKDQVRNAYNMEPRYRGTFEKELLKIDERVNICNMVFAGRLMRIYPSENPNSTTWIAPGELHQGTVHLHSNDFIATFFPSYSLAIQSAGKTGNWEAANKLVDDLCQHQQTNGGDILPATAKIKYEILLNKMNVFSRLGKMYGLIGLFILIMFFVLVFNPGISSKWPLRIAFTALGICFLAHMFGLGLRWYVSGRAPWSNGYESMIYIAFTTMLAGLIFGRKSLGGLAATAVLSSTILMVAGMSWLDPEITPLVPVLKSYWLTIHVSMIAGSYGFLMLGAIIGVLNLILMIFTNARNKARTTRTVKEMTYISEMTMIGGLFMISIGTYLGGIWANESWGRYWGWDAKETWALVTILVYAFILHMRFIPGLRSRYAFNVASLFGLASVMMTYFGVNYYLSGLHSYAAGDPAPIPPFVFYTVGALSSISLLAYFRNKQNGLFA
ncbi:MAG: cytochrome c biogenesis protein CcsA, partial [Saprospiraceae bacterium]|nr:cytochrome c biogenesis protein CcsA [Saprospiraceae bacterium]